MAKNLAVRNGQGLKNEEMHALVDALFECSDYAYSPSGQKTVNKLSVDELNYKFK
jgi:DNA mismatch repair ATPase MutL